MVAGASGTWRQVSQRISINMGGYNSGRHGWRGRMEERKKLDIRWMRAKGWLRPGTSGSIQWNRWGESIGSISYSAHESGLFTTWTILSGDDSGSKVSISIPIRGRPCRFGGERLYWGCPSCGRTCEVLVLANTARFWGCRRCLRTRYHSQGLQPADRMQQRADAIYDRLGGADDRDLVHKPKWMRWKTFNRLMESANDYAAEADAAHALRIMRLFGKL